LLTTKRTGSREEKIQCKKLGGMVSNEEKETIKNTQKMRK